MVTIDFSPEGAQPCHVIGWIHDNLGEDILRREYPAVIICPGGGYLYISAREAEPVAEQYYSAGYNTFILYYSVREHAKDFEPLIQLIETIAEIKRNSKAWATIPDQIAVCGFSAGGHLACSTGTLANTEEFKRAIGREEIDSPDAMILGYPVICANEFAHIESIENISGSSYGTEQFKRFGLDNHVTDQTPPAFIWHTGEDSCVPVENSLLLAAALSRNKVPFEMHIFPGGIHGLSVCTEQVATLNTYTAQWVALSIKWLDSVFSHIH